MTALPANRRKKTTCEPREPQANCLRTVCEPRHGSRCEPCVPVPIRHRTVRAEAGQVRALTTPRKGVPVSTAPDGARASGSGSGDSANTGFCMRTRRPRQRTHARASARGPRSRQSAGPGFGRVDHSSKEGGGFRKTPGAPSNRLGGHALLNRNNFGFEV